MMSNSLLGLVLCTATPEDAFHLAHLNQAGAEEIVVLTDITNQTALALYSKCGYTHRVMTLRKSLREEV